MASVVTNMDSSVVTNVDSSEEEESNWAELPPDVLSLIFKKLGGIEILFTAQAVCVSWMRLSHDPQLWRHIDMRNPWDLYDSEFDLSKMARSAIDRSCGQCDEFSITYFGTDELLQYLMERVSVLRCLRLISCYEISDEKLIEVAKKFPQLEELEMSHCSFLNKEVLENVGQSCPQLKFLRLNQRGCKPSIEYDEEALAIAGNMPKLRQLQIFGNNLTDNGLRSILDGCPHLESLDLRQCFSVNFAGNLRKTCTEKIRNLRFPNDSTDDYEFDAEIGGYGSYNDVEFGGYGSNDEEYPSGFSEIDLLSDEDYYEFSEADLDYDFSDLDFF